MSDGGGHLALVLMLTLLHGRLRLPICKTGFYFGVRQKNSDRWRLASRMRISSVDGGVASPDGYAFYGINEYKS